MPSSTPDWSALASDNERLVTMTAPGAAGSGDLSGAGRQGHADNRRAALPRACRPGRVHAGIRQADASAGNLAGGLPGDRAGQ
jgi:hypothetical protein